MLVLSRKLGQRLLVGDDVEISVVRIGRREVRIGIEAPKDVVVVRPELLSEAEPWRRSKGSVRAASD